MTVTRAQAMALLEPNLKGIRNDADFPRREKIYPQFYGVMENSRKAQIHFFERAGIGDYQVKNEGGPVSYTDPLFGTQITFTPVRHSNGYKITQEMLDHDQYAEVRKLEMDLQLANDDFEEVRGHLLLNNGFGTTNSAGFRATGFDGLALFSTAHTRIDGGTTQANRPSTDVNLDWTALANARQQFQLWRDNRGRVIRGLPRKLIVHPDDELTARELLGSAQKPGTANNEINALANELQLIVSPYITSTNDWFVFGDRVDTVWFWDVAPRTASQEDFDTEVIKRKSVLGMAHGNVRWFNVYGTSGTA